MNSTRRYTLRKQYHARRVGQDLHVWDVHNLLRAAKQLEVIALPLSKLAELDENWWYGGDGDVPTPRTLAEHFALMSAADLHHPIILCAEGRLMDGMHRALKALAEGRTAIGAVQFVSTPPPDFVNVSLDDLPYPDEEV